MHGDTLAHVTRPLQCRVTANPSHATTDTPAHDATFPNTDDLCERCGYALTGLSAANACPECGLPLSESHPDRRRGLSWQHGTSLLTWLRTARDVLLRPRQAFDQMRLGPAKQGRRFMVLVALLVGLIWAGVAMLVPPFWPIRFGLAATGLVLIMCLIEAVGVTFWSRRKGHKMTFAVAQSVVGYAAIAWLPGALLCAKAWLIRDGYFIGRGWWLQLGSKSVLGSDLTYLLVVGTFASFWFEVLVWYGVRRVRYANQRPIAPEPN